MKYTVFKSKKSFLTCPQADAVVGLILINGIYDNYSLKIVD